MATEKAAVVVRAKPFMVTVKTNDKQFTLELRGLLGEPHEGAPVVARLL